MGYNFEILNLLKRDPDVSVDTVEVGAVHEFDPISC